MTATITRDARAILADGAFCYVGAATQHGPHVTPMVFAFDGGRLWVTTSRGSVKARAWRDDPRVAGMVRSGDRAVIFRGKVTTYDALDPFTWPSAITASPRLVSAATRFTIKNARFFFGYAVAAPQVPLAWAPPGRVFVRIDMTSARVLRVDAGVVEDGWGAWPTDLHPSAGFTEVGSNGSGGPEARAPRAIRAALGSGGDAVLGVQAAGPGEGAQGPAILTVLPARWSRHAGAIEAVLPIDVLSLGALRQARGAASLTVDRASAWRASEMRGMLIRGTGETFALPGTRRGVTALRTRLADGEALVRVRPERVVWWEGWTSGTVVAPEPALRIRSPG